MSAEVFTTVLIVPTGIGCAIGGYAGDALPVARAFAAAGDRLITHPNVLNGASLYWPLPNALYVEGYGLDAFASGRWALRPVRQNRIGLLLDSGMEPDLQIRHRQVADAARATLGLEIAAALLTDQPLGVTLRQATSGASWGTLDNPGSLLRGAEKLIGAGCTALAVVARFPDDLGTTALESYRHGQGVDPLAGAEAVISHLIVREFQIPAAHAPALLPLPLDPQLSPRSAAEELGYTFLPCVLAGLNRAPQFTAATAATDITTDSVDVVVVPLSACGGKGVLHWAARGTTILAVEENTTTVAVPPEALGLRVQRVKNYLEALGLVVVMRAGIGPQSLGAKASPLRSL
jgi:hypothetical protein